MVESEVVRKRRRCATTAHAMQANEVLESADKLIQVRVAQTLPSTQEVEEGYSGRMKKTTYLNKRDRSGGEETAEVFNEGERFVREEKSAGEERGERSRDQGKEALSPPVQTRISPGGEESEDEESKRRRAEAGAGAGAGGEDDSDPVTASSAGAE
eukprot:755026-Hanusia_phi.AAC.1